MTKTQRYLGQLTRADLNRAGSPADSTFDEKTTAALAAMGTFFAEFVASVR